MRAVLPGKPQTKLQALSTALWDGIRIVAYISGNALVILTGAQTLLQTIYVDDTDCLETISIDEASGQIAVSGGSDIFVYRPNGFKGESLKWSLVYTFSSEDDKEDVNTLSWGSSEELLVANSSLSVWFLNDTPRLMWKKKLASPAKFAEFSPDAELVATTGRYDRLVKIWRRLSFGADDVRFEVFYLPHPAAVTKIHWRKPFHREQSIDNVLYTMCADGKVRVWAMSDHQSLSVMHLWTEIDMNTSIQPRDRKHASSRRYAFIVDGRDFRAATERAVQRNTQKDNLALEHLVEVANKSPDVCVVLDDYGHMCAWALENIGGKTKSATDVFNILHIEGLHFSFLHTVPQEQDYAQFYSFGASTAEDSLSILVHYFDGRIEWFDSQVDVLFDPTPRKNRLTSRGTWSGHTEPIKKIVRSARGHVLVSRTDDNNAMIWRQRFRNSGSIMTSQSSLSSPEHIHRTCVIEDGYFLVNLHHGSLSLWDIRSSPAVMLDSRDFSIASKPLCVLTVPNPDPSDNMVYIATISADMKGIAWEVELFDTNTNRDSTKKKPTTVLRQFCTFDMGLDDDVAYVLAVDPAGQMVRSSGSLDVFAADIALSYTEKGTIHTWAAKVDKKNSKLDWLLTSSVETGIANPSLASGSSIRKAALVDQERTHLSIWDTSGAQLEFDEQFPDHDMIRDLDWTSTPDQQSILAVGFSHKVVLFSQLRYDYLDAGPSWTPVREIRIRDLTPHPIGDSCWLGSGNLVVGTGNQLFVYDKEIEAHSQLVSELRIPTRGSSSVDIFDVVSRLNGPLPVYHPQFLAQCILSGKMSLVHLILLNLHKKLKFYTEEDDIDTFLEIPIEFFYRDSEGLEGSWQGHRSSDDLDDHEPQVLDENVAAVLNENLTRVTLPQLSSQEQFRLVDTIECVATVEKHRRSMDPNAARYLLFFRQHMLRRSQGVANKDTVSWREIVWALHSGSQDIITDLVSKQFGGKILWKSARESGIFMWLSDLTGLRAQLEIVARNEYTKTEEKNPIDCSLYYLALRKKNILQGLWRMATWNREQAATQRLLANNFEEPRWRTAALKNAYTLLGKRRFEYAAAFFLLADHLREAANVCINQIGDIQLAIAITRAYEGDDGPVLKEILEGKILTEAASEGNRWMASWAFWMLNRRSSAVRSLVSPVDTLIPPTPTSPGSPGMISLQARSYLSNDPALVVLYKQIREKTLQTIKGAAQIPPDAEWAFVLRNARLYDRMGCDLLALDIVAHWEFLQAPPPRTLTPFTDTETDYRKYLRRRSSLVIADLPTPLSHNDGVTDPTTPAPKPKPKPTTFQEPDANSLLDSFGF